MNIEDLYNQNTPENTTQIIEELLSKTYDNVNEIHIESLRLQRKFKCSPNKVQLAKIYNNTYNAKTHINSNLFKRYFKYT